MQTLLCLTIITRNDSFSSCIHTSPHVCSDWHNGIRVRTKCLPIKEQGENESDVLHLRLCWNECSALFGYAVWAEIDCCEKHALKSPCIQMKQITHSCRDGGVCGRRDIGWKWDRGGGKKQTWMRSKWITKEKKYRDKKCRRWLKVGYSKTSLQSCRALKRDGLEDIWSTGG